MPVITFSRNFPSYHNKAGNETFFVEKLWMSFIAIGAISLSRACELSRETGIGNFNMNTIRKADYGYKSHTIRKGLRWKAGDMFSPRIWGTDVNPKSGKSGPYHSKQIIIGPDIELKKVWTFEVGKKGKISLDEKPYKYGIERFANHDGLDPEDLKGWFKYPKPFLGQVLCWDEDVCY